MKNVLEKITYSISTIFFGLLAVLFIFILAYSVQKNLIYSYYAKTLISFCKGNYVGLIAGLITYLVLMPFLLAPRIRYNHNWFMKFTHELTHTLIAVCFFAKIKEFVVKEKECYVSYNAGPIGYVPITLAPYCIPIYTLMLFPFRFAGDHEFMIAFDFLIAFTYAFHLHAFIKQTRFTQTDIQGCGYARSVTFIASVHLCILSLIIATPNSGVLKALKRVFLIYPADLFSDITLWFKSIINLM